MNEHHVEIVRGKLLLALFHLHQVRSQECEDRNLASAMTMIEEATNVLTWSLGFDSQV